jgi:hypothetical protein
LQVGNFSHIAKQLKTLRVIDECNKRGQAQARPFSITIQSQEKKNKKEKKKNLGFSWPLTPTFSAES